MRRLFLFTSSFPYGNAESFLEDEIIYLCERFNEVMIIPLSGWGEKCRTVPPSCKVIQPVIKNKRIKFFYGFFNYRTFYPYLKDFVNNKVITKKSRTKTWLASYFNTNLLLNSKSVREVLNQLREDDICYSYWGINSLSYFLSGKCRFVSRFHGEWDLWEESSGDYATLRKEILQSLSAQFFISNKGKDYLARKYYCNNAIVSRLGTQDYGKGNKSTDGVLRVVSCSSVYPLKRVPLIFDVLNHYNASFVEWTHLGGGRDFDLLLTYTQQKANPNIKVSLLGQVTHKEVIEYYKNNKVDCFINLSTNEGVPVSIMEALSFDIPVIATNVGSTAEAVTADAGILVNSNPSIEEVLKAIDTINKGNYNPRKVWEQRFNADCNYREFANHLYIL